MREKKLWQKEFIIVAIIWSNVRTCAFFYHVEERDRLYHAVNAHVVKEKQTGRELVSKGDGRRKTRRETSARAVRNCGGEDA